MRQPTDKRRSWKDLAPRVTGKPPLSLQEAAILACAWFGENAEVFPPCEDWDTFAIGWWDHALPTGDDAHDADKWPDLHLEGCGKSLEAAFQDANPHKWVTRCVRERKRRLVTKAPAQEG